MIENDYCPTCGVCLPNCVYIGEDSFGYCSQVCWEFSFYDLDGNYK